MLSIWERLESRFPRPGLLSREDGWNTSDNTLGTEASTGTPRKRVFDRVGDIANSNLREWEQMAKYAGEYKERGGWRSKGSVLAKGPICSLPPYWISQGYH